jgi:plastocyanin
MNESLIIGVLILLAILVIGGLVYYLVLMPSKYAIPIGAGLQADLSFSANGELINISISNFNFNPSDISIKIGDTVKWTNDDQAPHQIFLLGFVSQVLNTGDSYSYTFKDGGIFDYHCNIHPSMTGNVSVKP